MINPIVITNAAQLKEIAIDLKEAAFNDADFFPPQYSKTKKEAFRKAKKADISENIRKVLIYNDNYYSIVMTYDAFLRIPIYHLSMSHILENSIEKVDDETAKFFATNILGNYTETPDETPFQTIRHFLEEIA